MKKIIAGLGIASLCLLASCATDDLQENNTYNDQLPLEETNPSTLPPPNSGDHGDDLRDKDKDKGKG